MLGGKIKGLKHFILYVIFIDGINIVCEIIVFKYKKMGEAFIPPPMPNFWACVLVGMSQGFKVNCYSLNVRITLLEGLSYLGNTQLE